MIIDRRKGGHWAFRLAKMAALGLSLLAVMGLSSSCSSGSAEVDERGWPLVLRVGHNPPEEETQRMARDEIFKALAKYLEKRLGVEVRIIKVGSPNVAIEGMRANKLDIVNYGSFAYLIAREKIGAEPMIIRGSTESGMGEYKSYIITSAKSSLRSIDDVVERAGELTLSFSDPASTSGHLVPRGYFDERGIVPEKAFKQVVFAMNHTTNILTAVSGKVDISAVASTTFSQMLRTGMISKEDVRIIWESPWMPSGPIAIRGNLPEDFKNAVRAAYLEMSVVDPETWALVKSVHTDPNTVYLPGDDSVYDYYRTIARRIEHMKLLD